MTTTSGNVMVELFDFNFKKEPDERYGQVVISNTVTVDDLIKKVVASRTDLNAATLKNAFELIKDAALSEILNGASVHFGLSRHSLSVRGVFKGDLAQWDPQCHALEVNAVPSAELRNGVKQVKVIVRGKAASGTRINTVTDLSTGQCNTRLTPGGGLHIKGHKLKLVGNPTQNGFTLTHLSSGETFHVGAAQLLVNMPTELMFVVPTPLPAGQYRLALSTQFSQTATLRKRPQTAVFNHLLELAQ